MASGYRVGVDVGGTFTDLICVTPDGDVVLDKTPSTLDDQSRGVMVGLERLAQHFDLPLHEFCAGLDVIVHGTTTADNTMIEMDGAATGLLVTEGHRDEIEMRRVHKEQIWDPSFPAPTPIARRRARIAIPQRHDFEGNEILPLDEEAVRRGVRRLGALGCDSIAVVYLFSFVNPDHEIRTEQIIREELPDIAHISLSHRVMPRGPEYERTSTTLVNAYVAPRIERYLSHLSDLLADAGYQGDLLVMGSSGGVAPPEGIGQRAVSVLASGPTGGVMGAAVAAGRSGVGDFVATDMGGTSYDLCLVRDGKPEVKTDWNWRYRYYIGMPMVDVQSVGAGGGSIARVRQGALLVGPESAGATPGPACYGQGGERPTVTDADAALGYLPPTGFAAGRMTLDVDAARAAIDRDVAQPLGVSIEEAAWGIERIVNANMANATRRVLSSYGADPRELAFIAYGGNGPVHAWAIAAELGIGRVLVPKAAPAFSALGLLVSDYVFDRVRSHIAPLSQVNLAAVKSLVASLREEAAAELAPTDLGPDDVAQALFAQMCYPGQNFDMSVHLDDPDTLGDASLLDLADRFHNQHESDRGFAFRNQQPLVRGVRLLTTGATPKPPTLAHLGKVSDPSAAARDRRPVWFGESFVDTAVIDGSLLAAGASVTGPALIEEPFTVVVVPPGATAALDEHGSYHLTLS
ncbi:MAG TPA: hydantoinase/oxoprolinase family protein [Acidimicrobiales bacterium]